MGLGVKYPQLQVKSNGNANAHSFEAPYPHSGTQHLGYEWLCLFHPHTFDIALALIHLVLSIFIRVSHTKEYFLLTHVLQKAEREVQKLKYPIKLGAEQ